VTETQFGEFDAIRKEFRKYTGDTSEHAPWLGGLQEELRQVQGYDDYRIETPVVYNLALDDISPSDSPRFIIVADNPGKNEQKAENRRYLVGQSGKLAQGWFRKELGTDFRSAALIINKTPIHTPKTAEIGMLKKLAAARSRTMAADLDRLLGESQRRMADFAFRLHRCLGGVLWVSGYGELKPKGLFADWNEAATRLYLDASGEEGQALRDTLWVFRHFSMNQFAIEYRQAREATTPSGSSASSGASHDPLSLLKLIGEANRRRILGF
jgi:hypothetical protein